MKRVKDIKLILQDALDTLECFDEDMEVKMVSNTYFLGNPYAFMGIAGEDGGYISLTAIEEYIDKESEE